MKDLNRNIILTQYCRIINGGIESVNDLIDRVVKTIAEVEIEYKNDFEKYRKEFKDIIVNNYFIPSGRILNNAGSIQSQISSCFVLPIEDDFASIFEILKVAANCHRLGGGTGFNFSKLREKGAPISSSESSGSSGPVSWMKLFNSETTTVMEGGKRRGANIGILSVYHPDIIEFINCKDEFMFKNFNISVLVDDLFFQKLDKGEKIKLISPLNNKLVRYEDPKHIWQNIVKQIHKTGDPGLLFAETINRNNPIKVKTGQLDIANPCGEQIMYKYESSFLGSINLASFYNEMSEGINWTRLKEVIWLAVRFLDNAVDANKYPNKKIENVTKSFRRIGLGIMGFADLLIKLRIPYDSKECIILIEKIGTFLKENADLASNAISVEKGNFPKINKCQYLKNRRNIAITAIAPTGTISMIANCSSGIEPRFSAYYNKNVIKDEGIEYIDELLMQTLVNENHVEQEKAVRIIRSGAYKEYLDSEQLRIFKYAHEISFQSHVQVVSEWQKYIDNGISKTVNLRNDATLADVDNALKMAWEKGCKGITIYREGSHKEDLLKNNVEKQTIQSKEKTKLFLKLSAI